MIRHCPITQSHKDVDASYDWPSSLKNILTQSQSQVPATQHQRKLINSRDRVLLRKAAAWRNTHFIRRVFWHLLSSLAAAVASVWFVA